MILLHSDGSIIEVGAVELIRPLSSVDNKLVVEIVFSSGNKGTYADVWWAKGDENPVSIYDMMLGAKFPVSWRDKIKIGGR